MTAGEIVESKIALEILGWKAEALERALGEQKDTYVDLFAKTTSWPTEDDKLALSHFEGAVGSITQAAMVVADEQQRLRRLLKQNEIDE